MAYFTATIIVERKLHASLSSLEDFLGLIIKLARWHDLCLGGRVFKPQLTPLRHNLVYVLAKSETARLLVYQDFGSMPQCYLSFVPGHPNK